MFRPLEFWIGLRYTRAKRRNHFISFISLASVLGIAIGVTALITVVSVMNGFEKELRARILGMVSHATISGFGEDLPDWPKALEFAKSHPEVVGAAPYIEREAMLQGVRVAGAMLRGVHPELEPQVSDLADDMVAGSLQSLTAGGWNIILGRELALVLGVSVGESLVVYAPQLATTPVGVVPQLRRFTVVGVFEAGMQEYDRGLAFVHLEDAGRLYRMGQGVTGVRLKLTDMFRAWDVARELADEMGGFYRIRDWSREHFNFFRAVRMEKLVMFVILSLIVAVAAFNLVSSLVMLVTDKQADIAILRTLGASPRMIMGTFMVQGMLLGIGGTVLGLIGGITLASNLETLVQWLERQLGFELMSAEVYYISELPSELRWGDIGVVTAVALVMSVLATLYPAWRASRTEPAAALRYE
jgi:lipoprotein-releasing system permease protein